MNVDFGVVRTLIMHHIANIWDIKTTSGNVRAYQNSTSYFIVSWLNVTNCSLELIKVLKSLFLLHLRMKTKVFDFKEIQKWTETTSSCDSITENNNAFSFFLLQEIIQVQIFFFNFSPNHILGKRGWHGAFAFFNCQIDDFWVLRSEFQSFTKFVQCTFSFFYINSFFFISLFFFWGESAGVVNCHSRRTYNMLDSTIFQIILIKLFLVFLFLFFYLFMQLFPIAHLFVLVGVGLLFLWVDDLII